MDAKKLPRSVENQVGIRGDTPSRNFCCAGLGSPFYRAFLPYGGVVTTYQYNPAGDPTGTTYSDGTPAITYTLRRDGRRVATTDTAGTHGYE